MVRKGYTNSVTLDQNAEIGQGVIYTAVWREDIPGIGESKGKCPEIQVCLMCLRGRKENSPVTTEQTRG